MGDVSVKSPKISKKVAPNLRVRTSPSGKDWYYIHGWHLDDPAGGTRANLLELAKYIEEKLGESEEIKNQRRMRDWWQSVLRGEDKVKWYEHEQDMIEVSKKFPEIEFILEGDGEEGGDLWRKYFRGGTVYIAKAQVTVVYDELVPRAGYGR